MKHNPGLLLRLLLALAMTVPAFALADSSSVKQDHSETVEAPKDSDGKNEEPVTPQNAEKRAEVAVDSSAEGQKDLEASQEHSDGEQSTDLSAGDSSRPDLPTDSAEVRVQEGEEAADGLPAEEVDVAGESVIDPGAIEEEEINILSGQGPDYRSPRRAMLFSFLIPGMGQYYVRSRLKALFYVLIEIAGFAARDYYNDLGDAKDLEFREYCDAHYDTASYNTWRKWVETDFSSNFLGIDTTYLYHDSVYRAHEPKKTQQYYELIMKYNQFVQGWKDVSPTTDDLKKGGDHIPDSLNGIPYEVVPEYEFLLYHEQDTVRGYSAFQEEAAVISADATSLYKKGEGFWLVILANHVISAVDAGLAARRYNRALANQGQSHLDRIRLKSKTVAGRNSLIPVVCVQYGF